METSLSRFIFKAPFNSLSFGQVSVNLCYEMWKKDLDVSIFPISDNVDLSSYKYLPEEFFSWLKSKIESRYTDIDNETKCISLWHIRSSDNKPTKNSFLYTFHEINGVTETEKKICSLHEKVIFSSEFSKQNFENNGVANCDNLFVGFDENIKSIKPKKIQDCIHYILVGKWESRKNTELIISSWAEKFGNNIDYKLTCLVDNPFLSKDVMDKLKIKSLSGRKYFNINFLPRLSSNLDVFDLYNSCDIDLSGLSSSEGWNLPAFNATCLGKWSCVLNHTSHKDWATENNSILIEPIGLRPPYDNVFFRENENYNQGFIYEVNKESIFNALDKSIEKYNSINEQGKSLQDKFSYSKMLDSLILKTDTNA